MEQIRALVRQAYSAAAAHPEGRHPFPAGVAFASSLGYATPLLNDHPGAAEAFAGVSCIPGFAEVDHRMALLDVGCGAGLDALAIGPRVHRIVGIDFSAEMLSRAALHMEVVQGDAERMPFRGSLFDAALANGIFNLNPSRAEILGLKSYKSVREVPGGIHLIEGG